MYDHSLRYRTLALQTTVFSREQSRRAHRELLEARWRGTWRRLSVAKVDEVRSVLITKGVELYLALDPKPGVVSR